MKKILIVFGLIGLLSSCSSSDSGSSATGNYFPLKTGNYWTYDVTGAQTGHDSLFIAKDTVIAAKTYQKFETAVTPVGFFSNSMNNNSVRNENGKLYLTGAAGLDFGAGLPINLALTDFVIFDPSASDDSQMASNTGTIDQTLGGYPLTITYTLKTINLAPLATFTAPDGTVYNDVKPVKTVLNLKITTTLGPLPVTVLDTQDVVNSTQYYANNIGVVTADTTIHYTIDSNIAGLLGIPATLDQEQKETLDTYHLAP